MTRAIRLALYGDVNLNIIDGSAVWLVSLAEVLTTLPRVELTVVLKAREQRSVLSDSLRSLPRTSVVAPEASPPLPPPTAIDAIERLDRELRFDVIVLRGRRVALEAASRPSLAGRIWPYLTDIPQMAHAVTGEDRAQLTAIAAASARLLCQTEELRSFLEGLLPPEHRRTVLLPPMVPDAFFAPRDQGEAIRQRRIFYAGKFAPDWGFLETVEAIHRIRIDRPDVEFHVAGDKVHEPTDDPEFAPAVRAALSATDGLIWHGAIRRDAVADLLRTMSIALSARAARMNESLELSTKVLEYAAAGAAVVLNRTPMHERLFGAHYPLFVEGLTDIERVLRLALSDADRLRDAREIAVAVARDHRVGAVAAGLRPWLDREVPVVAAGRGRRPRIVIAGHDLKFFRPLQGFLERSGAEVRIDAWEGHGRHDPDQSHDLLRWGDSVICEWFLGNASWYARHRGDGQRLFVRFHRQELETRYPEEVEPDSFDAVVFVADRIRDEAMRRYGWNGGRLSVIPNAVDTLSLDRPKLPSAPTTLGLLGYLPSLKRLDRALDLLEALRRAEPAFRLVVAGRLPWETTWVWSRLEEQNHYAEQFERIRTSPILRRAVSIESHVADVPSWFRRIGFILSLSDQESFHLAAAEGMASRAVPVIAPWAGADAIYPARWIVDNDIARSVDSIVTSVARGRWRREGEIARQHIDDHYRLDDLAARWLELVLG